MNEYVKFYEKNKISPVRQDISDFKKHIKRREMLYRQLGLLRSSFENKKILEVGPAGGYNALATYTFNPSKYVLVEPNKTGFDELRSNFSSKNFTKNIEFHNTFLEDFKSDEKFDVVICEGLVQGLPNRKDFLLKLSSKVKDGGILVITVGDEISMFFEVLRRYLANELIKNEKDFTKQTNILVKAFSSHLDTLKGMTRRYDDWCIDLICDAIYNHTFSVKNAIELFTNEYYFYGASPNIFQDFRWYKALPQESIEYNQYFIKQFSLQQHNLINSAKVYEQRDEKSNSELSKDCRILIDIVKSLEKADNTHTKQDLIFILEKIALNLKTIDNDLVLAVEETLHLITKENISTNDVKNMTNLAPLFGKASNFISFYKEINCF